MGIDCGKRFGHAMLIGWRPGCRADITDYTTFEVPSGSMRVEKALLAVLCDFRDEIILPGWRTVDGRTVLPAVVLVDAGWLPDVVYEFCRDQESGTRFDRRSATARASSFAAIGATAGPRRPARRLS